MFDQLYTRYNIKKDFAPKINKEILEVIKERELRTEPNQMDLVREYLKKKHIDDLSLILDSTNGQGKLYIGTVIAANDIGLLKEHGIRSVLSLMTDCDIRYHPYDIVCHKKIELDDTEDTEISKHLEDIVSWIDRERNLGRNVLVHCKAGVSRSGAAVVAYLMQKHWLSYEAALRQIQLKRKCCNPNEGFRRQLQDYYEILRGKKPIIRFEKAKLPELAKSQPLFVPFMQQHKTLNYIGNYKNQYEVVLLKNQTDRNNYFKNMLSQGGKSTLYSDSLNLRRSQYYDLGASRFQNDLKSHYQDQFYLQKNSLPETQKSLNLSQYNRTPNQLLSKTINRDDSLLSNKHKIKRADEQFQKIEQDLNFSRRIF